MFLAVRWLVFVTVSIAGLASVRSSLSAEEGSSCGVRLTWSEESSSTPNAPYELARRDPPFGSRRAIPGIQFQGLGFVYLKNDKNLVKYNFNVSLKFQSFRSNALLLYLGGFNQGDFISLQLEDGHVVLYFHNGGLGDAARAIDNTHKHNDGQVHSILAYKNDSLTALLFVDGNGPFVASFNHLFLLLQGANDFFLGGVPPGLTVHAPATTESFSGCLFDVYIEKQSLEDLEKKITNSSMNVLNRTLGCPLLSGRGVYFKGAGYLRLINLFSLSRNVRLELSFSFKTTRKSGLLLAAQGGNQSTGVVVHLFDGVVSLTAVTSDATKTVASGGLTCDGRWHSIRILIDRRNVSIRTDNVTESIVILDTYDVFYMGGVESGTSLASLLSTVNVSVTSFSGCIQHLTVNGNETLVDAVAESGLHVSLAGCPDSSSSSLYCVGDEKVIYKGILRNTTDLTVAPFSDYFYQIRRRSANGTIIAEEPWFSVFTGNSAPSSSLPPSIVYNELGKATIKIPFPQNPNGIAERLLNEMFVYASYPGSHGSSAIITMAEVKAFGSELTMDLAVSTNYEFSINMWSPEGSSEIPRLSLVTPESFANCYRSYDRGVSYRGNSSVTASGGPCLPWRSTPFSTKAYPDSRFTQNYCRNPLPFSRTKPWCFINSFEWEYCEISLCIDYQCYSVKDKGAAYRGEINHTRIGASCTNWSNTSLYSNASQDGIGNHSFCRNALNRDRPWCYYNGDDQWDYCDIPMCNDVPFVPSTCNGTGRSQPCVFPFVFGGYRFFECTELNSSLPWCATSVDSRDVVKQWGYCLCPAEEPLATSPPTTVLTTSASPSTRPFSSKPSSTSRQSTFSASAATTTIAATTASADGLSVSASATTATAVAGSDNFQRFCPSPSPQSNSFEIAILVATAFAGLIVGIGSTLLVACLVLSRKKGVMEVDNELDEERGQQLASMNAYAEVDLKKTDSLNPNPLYGNCAVRETRFKKSSDSAKKHSRSSENPLYDITT